MRYFFILISTILALTSNSSSFGQNHSLTGEISTDSAESPVYYTSVFLSNQDTIIHRSLRYDESFHFSNLTNGQYLLRIYAFGKQAFDTALTIQSTNHYIKAILLDDQDAPTYPEDTTGDSYNKKTAKRHVQNGHLLLLMPGGKPRMHRPRMPMDYEFMRKHKVLFTSQGCIRSIDDDEKGYNKVVFRHLDKKYGRNWRKHLQLEVIGLKTAQNGQH